MSGPVVVLGASGFVGTHVVDALIAAGRPVRAGTRNPDRARRHRPDHPWVRADLGDTASLERSFRGADALVYLVHHMRAHTADDLVELEEQTAGRVRETAEEAGIRRIVYLGAPEPPGEPSPHLAARLATGAALRAGGVSTIELQASMIIGAGSESWLMVRDLAMRLPAMALPRWSRSKTQPIGIDDVVAAILHALEHPTEDSFAAALPGPETLTAREILFRAAAIDGRRPVAIPMPFITPGLSTHWIRLVTRADMAIARQLVNGLGTDLVAEGPGYWAHAPDIHRTPVREAMTRALADEAPPPIWQRRWERLARKVSRSVR
jgi:uncharacterized protein YbjT (DUF2867 family)